MLCPFFDYPSLIEVFFSHDGKSLQEWMLNKNQDVMYGC